MPHTQPTTVTVSNLEGVLQLHIAEKLQLRSRETSRDRELAHSANSVGSAPTMSKPDRTIASSGREARGRHRHTQPDSRCTTAPREGRIEHEVHLQPRAVTVTTNSRRRARVTSTRLTSETPTMPHTPPTTATTSNLEGVLQLRNVGKPRLDEGRDGSGSNSAARPAVRTGRANPAAAERMRSRHAAERHHQQGHNETATSEGSPPAAP